MTVGRLSDLGQQTRVRDSIDDISALKKMKEKAEETTSPRKGYYNFSFS